MALKVECIKSNNTKNLILNKIYTVRRFSKSDIVLFDDSCTYSPKRFRPINFRYEDHNYNYIDKRIKYSFSENSRYICHTDFIHGGVNIEKGDIFKHYFFNWKRLKIIDDYDRVLDIYYDKLRRYFWMLSEEDYLILRRKDKIKLIEKKLI